MEPITLTLLAGKVGAAILTKLGVAGFTAKTATIVGGTALVGGAAATGAAVCWAIESFAEKAAVKARARSVKKFFVTVLRTSWNIVKFVAETASGSILATDSMSYDDYPQYLDTDTPQTYSYLV